ncbi:hypothetical protein X729_30965 [Mesorhizobium sp. L103C131B0]|nr:hypothetical protein X729_30965 [Mesorhizobium sp. L103C131B0]
MPQHRAIKALDRLFHSILLDPIEGQGQRADPGENFKPSKLEKAISQDHGKRRNSELRRRKEDQRAHRLRHIGLMVGLVVHAADIQDRDGAPAALMTILERWPWLRHLFADGGYAGPKLKGGMQKNGTFTLGIVERTAKAKGFEVLPRRCPARLDDRTADGAG